MKEKQRWQPEEDALLRSYVKQYGPKEWNLITQRLGKPIYRDPKSCHERWKNYLKPGIKKGSLTLDEQNLVISLQSKYGNKWKKIASLVPGRTAKRLGKWWEVFKEKQLRLNKSLVMPPSSSSSSTAINPVSSSITTTNSCSVNEVGTTTTTTTQGKYDHILETFAEKYVQPKLHHLSQPTISQQALTDFLSPPVLMPNISLGYCSVSTNSSSVLPPWMMSTPANSSTIASSSTLLSPSVNLSLSSSEPSSHPQSFLDMGTLVQYFKDVEEGKQNWVQHKKEANWRLSRLEQQLESEKGRKRREIMDEFEKRIKCLREEEMGYFEMIDREYVEQFSLIQRDAEREEAKIMEVWSNKHSKFTMIVEHIRKGMMFFSTF